MFLRLIAFLLVTTFILDARTTVEVREGSGIPIVDSTNVYGKFNSRYKSRFPYVCYSKRIKVIDDGEMYVKYKGCERTDDKCYKFGKEHFGKYPNDYKASQALRRCINSRPRFVD
ncbi:hypothetical protein MNB_SV-15-920 [hydrothermal vent metagenome]|uniref:Uncharacterized protein n=1 Tax=hydrothermal vent metagenome TaxID=652676 RepID=A0A1W1EKH0_9ZZZZ